MYGLMMNESTMYEFSDATMSDYLPSFDAVPGAV